MSTKNIAIAYCADNEQVVRQIEQQLSSSGYQFQHFVGTKTTAGPPLADQLLNQPNPILLIVSDNFLKAAQCMQHGLKLLQEKRNQILPIVIEGLTEDEQTGKPLKIQTDFERVSDIIQYINYWQDQYLDLRRQKRQMKDFDENAFNTHLKIMREISSEAGEFLRVLRGMNYLTHQELVDNSFEHFFKFTDDASGWSRFKAQGAVYMPPPPAVPAEKEEAPAEEPTSPVVEEPEKIQEEQESAVPPVEEEQTEEEQTPVNLADIPGIDLIEERQEEPIMEAVQEEPQAVAPVEEEEENVEEVAPKEEIADAIAAGLEDAYRFAPPAEEITKEEVEAEVESTARSLSTMESEERLQPVEEDENESVGFYLDDDENDDLPEEEPLTAVLEGQEEEIEEEEEEDQVSVLVEEALEYFNTGQVQEGLAFMAQAVEENPDNPYLRYHYALMLAQRSRDYLSARKILKPVVQAEPDNEHALFLMGELNELLEDFDAARNYYLQLIDVNPRYPHAHYRLGLILAAHFEGKHKAASRYLKKAIKLDNQNADACYHYALLLNEAMNKPKRAIKLLKQTLKIDPQHPFANYDLAVAYLQLGQRSKARKAYARAIVINPELHTPENDLAFREKTPSPPVSVAEQDTIEALKENINNLEELLQSKEAEAALLRQEMETEKVPAIPQIDQTVLITGATSGIGRATAEIFAQNGYRVIITGRRAKRLEELKTQFKEECGADVLAIAYDVRDGAAVEEVMEKLGGKGLEVDILINNAGKAKGLAPIHEGKMEHWEEMIDTNLKGLLYMTRAMSPGMVKRKSGHIINVSSTAGRDVYPNGNVYCATKAAVEALTKAMRLDLHQHNVRVSMVSPAHVEETEFALVRFDGNEEQAKIYEGFKPLSARDVAEAIFFMASRPAHVNVLDVVLQGVQQASSLLIDRSGRELYEDEEEED